MHIFISELGRHWFRLWLDLYSVSAPSHWLNQCWCIVKWSYNKVQRNLNQNTCTMIFLSTKCAWKYHLQNAKHFASVSTCEENTDHVLTRLDCKLRRKANLPFPEFGGFGRPRTPSWTVSRGNCSALWPCDVSHQCLFHPQEDPPTN